MPEAEASANSRRRMHVFWRAAPHASMQAPLQQCEIAQDRPHRECTYTWCSTGHRHTHYNTLGRQDSTGLTPYVATTLLVIALSERNPAMPLPPVLQDHPGFVVILVSLAGCVCNEFLSWLLVYRRDRYKYLKGQLLAGKKRLEV